MRRAVSRAGPEPPRALPVGLQEAQGGRTPGGGVRLETRNLPAVFLWNRRQEPNSDTVFFSCGQITANLPQSH